MTHSFPTRRSSGLHSGRTGLKAGSERMAYWQASQSGSRIEQTLALPLPASSVGRMIGSADDDFAAAGAAFFAAALLPAPALPTAFRRLSSIVVFSACVAPMVRR